MFFCWHRKIHVCNVTFPSTSVCAPKKYRGMFSETFLTNLIHCEFNFGQWFIPSHFIQRNWKNILNTTVTGDGKPRGSYMPAIHYNIVRLVNTDFLSTHYICLSQNKTSLFCSPMLYPILSIFCEGVIYLLHLSWFPFIYHSIPFCNAGMPFS